jgi:hypothetical protein
LAKSLFLGRARIVIFVGNRVLGNGIVRERLCAFAWPDAAPATAAPTAPSAFSATFSIAFGLRLDFSFCSFCRRDFRFLRLFVSFDFFLDVLDG